MPVVFALIFMSLATAAYCAHEIVADTSLDRGHSLLVPGTRTSLGPDADNRRGAARPAPSTDGRATPSRAQAAAAGGSRKAEVRPEVDSKTWRRSGDQASGPKSMPRRTPSAQPVAQDAR